MYAFLACMYRSMAQIVPLQIQGNLAFLYQWLMHREHLAPFTGRLLSTTEEWEMYFNSVDEISPTM